MANRTVLSEPSSAPLALNDQLELCQRFCNILRLKQPVKLLTSRENVCQNACSENHVSANERLVKRSEHPVD